jgi:hypothetical protein
MQRCPHHRADGWVHAPGVAAAGEHRDAGERSCRLGHEPSEGPRTRPVNPTVTTSVPLVRLQGPAYGRCASEGRRSRQSSRRRIWRQADVVRRGLTPVGPAGAVVQWNLGDSKGQQDNEPRGQQPSQHLAWGAKPLERAFTRHDLRLRSRATSNDGLGGPDQTAAPSLRSTSGLALGGLVATEGVREHLG